MKEYHTTGKLIKAAVLARNCGLKLHGSTIVNPGRRVRRARRDPIRQGDLVAKVGRDLRARRGFKGSLANRQETSPQFWVWAAPSGAHLRFVAVIDVNVAKTAFKVQFRETWTYEGVGPVVPTGRPAH